MADFIAVVKAELDKNSLSQIETEINNIKQKDKLKINIDSDYIKNQLKTAFDGISKDSSINLNGLFNLSKASSTGKNYGKQIVSGLNKSMSSFNTTKLKNNGIDYMQKSFKSMEKMIPDIQAHFRNLGFDNVNISGVEKMGQNISKFTVQARNANGELKKFTYEAAKLQSDPKLKSDGTYTNPKAQKGYVRTIETTTNSDLTNVQKLMNSANKIALDVDTKGAESKITSLQSKLTNFGEGSSYYTSYQSSLQSLESAYNEVLVAKEAFDNDSSEANAEALVNANNKLVQSMKTTENEYKILSAEQGKLLSSSQIAGANNQFEKWCDKNSKACKVYAEEVADLRNQLSNMKTDGDLNKFNTDFKNLDSLMISEGNSGKSLADSFGSITKHAVAFASTYLGIYRVFSAITEGISTVIELDDALIDLKKTTTMSTNELSSFYTEANDLAKQYGATTEEIIQSAADWSRLGYNTKDQSEQMAAYSSQFATISPGMDVDSATTSLTSIMKAYDIQVEDVKDIMSKINEIGNTQATSNADIAEGLQDAASALSMTGTGFDQAVALFTSA